MSDLTSPPPFGGPVYTPAQALAAVGVSQTAVTTRTFRRRGARGDGTIEEMGPYPAVAGYNVDVAQNNLGLNNQVGLAPYDDTALQHAVTLAENELGTARGALSTARETEAACRSTYEAALAAVSEASVAVYKKSFARDVLALQGASAEAIAAATAAVISAEAALVAAQNAANQDTAASDGHPAVLSPHSKWLAAVGSVQTCQGNYLVAQGRLRFEQAQLAAGPVAYTNLQHTYEAFIGANPPRTDGTASPFTSFASYGYGNGASYDIDGNVDHYDPQVASFAGQSSLCVSGSSFSLPPAPLATLTPPLPYDGVALGCTYQHLVSIPADVYPSLFATGRRLKLQWQEASVHFAVTEVQYEGDAGHAGYKFHQLSSIPSEVDYSLQEESFDPGDAIQVDVGGPWVITGAQHGYTEGSMADPDLGEVVCTYLVGIPSVPQTSVGIVEYRGGERFKQGWRAFVSDDTAPTPCYLTMAASTGPGAPRGKDYTGQVHFGLPPYVTDEPDGWIQLGGYDPATAPLVVFSTLSDDVLADVGGFGFPLPDSNTLPSEDATLLSATERVMTKPPGLVWTLVAEQTDDSLAAAVADLAAQPWRNSDLTPSPSGIANLAAAINYQSPDGNYAAEQNFRYRLHFDPLANAAIPGTSFTATFAWALRRRNLLTGEVTMDRLSKSIGFPLPDGVDGDGHPLYRYHDDDTEWRTAEAPAGHTVDLVMLPGTIDIPSGFLPYSGALGRHDDTDPGAQPAALTYL